MSSCDLRKLLLKTRTGVCEILSKRFLCYDVIAHKIKCLGKTQLFRVRREIALSYLLPFGDWVGTPSRRHTALIEVHDPPKNN